MDSLPSAPSHLFVLRLWIEPGADGKQRLRGRIQHVLSGETFYFLDWQEMAVFAAQILEKKGDIRW